MESIKFKNITAIVLAGGKNSRMGGIDKSMLPVKGVPMIGYIIRQFESLFSKIIISANDIEKYSFLGHKVIPDEKEGMGPLMGIYSCLLRSDTDLNFITACDIPDINFDLVRTMAELSEGVDIVMPVNENNEYEPLHAIYRKTIIPEARKLLKENKLKISGMFEMAKVKYVPFDSRGWYHNLNFRNDYDNYIDKIIERGT